MPKVINFHGLVGAKLIRTSKTLRALSAALDRPRERGDLAGHRRRGAEVEAQIIEAERRIAVLKCSCAVCADALKELATLKVEAAATRAKINAVCDEQEAE